MAIDSSTWTLVLQMREQLTRIQDAHVRTLVAAWARAWEDVQADLTVALQELALQAGEDRITRSAVIKSQRLQNALALIDDQLNGLFEQSGQTAIAKLSDVVDNAGRTQEALIANQLPRSERAIVNAWSRVDTNQVAAIVQRSTEQITKLSFPLADEATATMRRELVRGLIVGDNPRVAAATMLKRTNGIFNGGLARALTIARTEQLDAHRAAAKLAEEANADVMAGWIWGATLTSRTCPACWSMNNREFPLNQSGPDGHQNCRCVRIPKTKSWAELGFDVKEPPPLLPDAEAQFAALPRDEQVNILGGPRYTAWRAGTYPMSAWAQQQDNPGWRQSYVTSSAKGRAEGPKTATGSGSGGTKKPRTPSTGGAPISNWARRSKAALTKADSEILDTIHDYTGNQYHEINNDLRDTLGVVKDLPDWEQTAIEHLDTAVNLVPFDAEMTLSRIVDPDAFGLGDADELESVQGKLFTEHGFLSTSRRSGKSDIRYLDPILLEVIAPPGTPAAAIAHLSMVPSEREVLLGRGLSYTLSNARYDRRRKMWRATMRIISIGGAA